VLFGRRNNEFHGLDLGVLNDVGVHEYLQPIWLIVMVIIKRIHELASFFDQIQTTEKKIGKVKKKGIIY
jgi:hypothetical protein